MSNTNQPKRAYLNKLVDVGRLLPDPQRGVWLGDPGAANFLSNLAHDIDIGGAVKDPRLAHSVPSVYARPILFAQALGDPKSPLHDSVVNQWRGLMAVIALESWIGYKVEFVAYKVPEPDANAASAVGRVPTDDLHLRTMLYSLLPEPKAFWSPLRLIYVNGALIGAASPWTMVFTPAGMVPERIVPWTDGNVLVDPLLVYKAGAIRSIELTILHQWIGQLIAAGQDQLNPNWRMGAVGGNFLAAIGRELVKWQTELFAHIDPAWNVPGLNPANADAGPYQYALRTSKLPMLVAAPGTIAAAAPPQSDLFIKVSRKGAGDVVALKRNGLPIRSRVHNGAFVEDIDTEHLPGSTGKSLQTKGGVVHDVEWVIAEEVFFPPKIARVNRAPDALCCGTDAAADYSLPLTTAFFKYFTHDDVSGMLKVVVNTTGAGSVATATLNLRLQGGQILPLEKAYTLSQDLAEIGADTPAFGLWPDFVSEDWTHNFATFVGPSALGDHAFTVKPLLIDGSEGTPTKVDGTEKDLRIWRCIEPPIGFALASNREEAGLVLRKWLREPSPRVPGYKWIVSVDFGTSNTMISWKQEGSADSAVLKLKPRLVSLNKGADAKMEQLSNGLYPQDGAIPPFMTLLYRLEATTYEMDPKAYSLRFEFTIPDMANLVRHLKWGSDPAPMQAYLGGLVRYIVCEARDAGVENLVLKWSYPLALPEPSKTAMASFWTAVTGTYKQPTVQVGHTLTAGKTQKFEDSVSESEATCRALAWHRNSPVPVAAGGLCIAIDVGGGSTDFAYWSEGNLLDQFSFKLAGNDVLCGEWLALTGFLEKITWAATGKMYTKEQLYPLLKMEGSQVEVLVNAILSQAVDDDKVRFSGSNPFSHPAVGRIFSGGPKSRPWFQIRTLALLLFGGVSYYAGLHARDFGEGRTIKDQITLCFGGRGANLLTWLWNNPGQLKTALSSFFIGGYTVGGRPAPTVNIEGAPVGGGALFPPLKEEVATGNLAEPIGTVKSTGNPRVGEVGWSQPGNPNPIEWNTTLTVDTMATLVPPKDASTCYIMTFLNSVISESNPEVTKLNIDLQGIHPNALHIDWQDIQNRLRKDIQKTGVSQPVFAIELKSLMNKYVSHALRAAAATAGN